MKTVKLEITLPVEIVERIDEVLGVLGFRSREELAVAAIRRLVDRYKTLTVRAL